MIEIRNMNVDGAISLEKIYDFSLIQKYNEHAYATVKAYLPYTTALNSIDDSRIVTVHEKNKLLFEGYIQKIEIYEDTSHEQIVELELVSKSIKWDLENRTRSFQDISLTYKKLNKIVCETSQWLIDEKMTLGRPLIQYYETDWQFLKRINSHLGYKIFPTIGNETSDIGVGYDKNSAATEIDIITSKTAYSKEYLSNENGDMRDYLYYEIISETDVALGKKIIHNNNSFIIFEKRVQTNNNELIFTYKIGGKNFIKNKFQFNSNFIGRTIQGQVMSTKKETIRVHLEIDKTQEEATAYDYPYEPETGNVMYCMPMMGTTVSLYFGDWDERTGRIINCVRTNGADSCSDMQDNDNKVFTTEFNKQMFMGPTYIKFTSDITNPLSHYFLLDDLEGIFANSDNKISMTALENITISGINAGIGCVGSIAIAQGIDLTGNPLASILLKDDTVDTVGDSTSTELTFYYRYPVIEDKPEQVHASNTFWKVLAGIAVAVVAAIAVAAIVAAVVTCPAVVAFAPALFGGATFSGVFAAGAITGSIVGGIAVTAQGISDAQNDTNRSFGDYMWTGFANSAPAAFTGAFFSAASSSLSILQKVNNLSNVQTFRIDLLYTLGDTNLSFLATYGLNRLATDDIYDSKLSGGEMTINSIVALFTHGLTKGIDLSDLNRGRSGFKINGLNKRIDDWIDKACGWLGEEADVSRFMKEYADYCRSIGDTSYQADLLQYQDDVASTFAGSLPPEVFDKYLFNAACNAETLALQDSIGTTIKSTTGTAISGIFNGEKVLSEEDVINEHNKSLADRNINPVEAYVTRGAVLRCTCSKFPRLLDLREDNAFRLDNSDDYPHPYVSENQCEYGEEKNIKMFGICNKSIPDSKQATYVLVNEDGSTENITGTECKACLLSTIWFDTEADTALSDSGKFVKQKSFMACKYGGFIEFQNSGIDYRGQKESGEIEVNEIVRG